MRRYLETLHEKPAHHKRRFAFLVSAGFTLFMFSLWSLVTFGEGGTLAQKNGQPITDNLQEIGPIESLVASVGGSISNIKESFEELLNIYGGR